MKSDGPGLGIRQVQLMTFRLGVGLVPEEKFHTSLPASYFASTFRRDAYGVAKAMTTLTEGTNGSGKRRQVGTYGILLASLWSGISEACAICSSGAWETGVKAITILSPIPNARNNEDKHKDAVKQQSHVRPSRHLLISKAKADCNFYLDVITVMIEPILSCKRS
ncbi:unnamed protein product [Caretta caretta]